MAYGFVKGTLIKYMLVIFSSFVPPVHSHILQVRHHYRSKCLAGLAFLFPFLEVGVEYIPSTHRNEDSRKVHYDFSLFNELCRCCFQQWPSTLPSVCGEHPIVLATILVVWGGFPLDNLV